MTKISNNVLLDYLHELFPDAHCELNYHNLFELLIAVSLSAQTTDIAVNFATPKLFECFPTPLALANANIDEVESIIHKIGLYHNKAKNIIATSKMLVEQYDSVVPNTMEELVKLPGVGRKTASVVLIEGLKIPAFPVDTHVNRVSKRLKIAKETDDVLIVEKKLRKLIPPEFWGIAHHQMIFFGRYFCTATKPHCFECKLKEYCQYKKK